MSNTLDIQSIRENASRSYDLLSSKDSTVYAVAHARKENTATTYKSKSIVGRFMEILPMQDKSFDEAVKMMEEKQKGKKK